MGCSELLTFRSEGVTFNSQADFFVEARNSMSFPLSFGPATLIRAGNVPNRTVAPSLSAPCTYRKPYRANGHSE
jgi:hypothetical protein